jgi:polyisoprenyl-teichoic acid--peptidoglycan teichoic acid transferase
MSDESSADSEQSYPFGADASEPGQEGAPRSHKPRRAHRGVRWGKIAIITVAVLFASVAAAVGYFGVKVNNEVSSIARSSLLPSGSRPPSASPTTNTTYTATNILLIGSDSRGTDTGRSDSFIVMHISADRKSVYLVSFPRDMWVSIPGYGKAKINAAYSYGQSALAVSTIEALTGARIDHVVITDFTDFVALVDSIGPITVDNPVKSVATSDRGVKYDFPMGPLVITDGYMALAFARQREELPNGDLDRTLRQRAFLKAVALKIATPDVLANPVKLNAVIATVGKYVTVDSQMTNEAIYSLGFSLTGITSANQIHMLMAPITGFGMINSQSVDVVDVPGVAALGKALQNDTMAAFVAAHPSTEYGYTPSAVPSASSSPTAKATTTRAKATATATKK